MRTYFLHLIQVLFFVSAFSIIGGVFAGTAAAAPANLGDGTYNVPITLKKAGDKNTDSMAAHFFTSTASVNVNQGNYTITLTTNGANYIGSMIIGGQTVAPTVSDTAGNGTITFQLNNPDNYVPVTFNLINLPMPDLKSMTESAQFFFDWQAVKTATPTVTTSTNSNATGSITSTSSDPQPATNQPTVAAANNTAASSTQATPDKPSATKATVKKSTTKKTTVPTTTRTYVVLKGASNTKSMANQYYTRKAIIKKINKHYNVALEVSYKKSLKLGTKAVRPITINNRKVKAGTVKYGQTSKSYTMTYSFNIASFKTLKHLIKGSIHVTVPYMKISQTFPIRFKFSQKAPAKAHQHAAFVMTAASYQSLTGGRDLNEILQ
ncbi:hypothetical protein YK48G_05230 [Lentilactobacillus fungorum]|uniref:NEAT domain-containing protein n=1 Tax=Lentilactobacillus fungorum TaxID=2201250 RepID=A0ABQ3VW11_9LACO|nr:NEAT domain-containing protein [Lentilactobacillus fungorum]GHP13098.1 hypothetical protein YK48G_05230 [Lentilactobacillus fungorum]